MIATRKNDFISKKEPLLPTIAIKAGLSATVGLGAGIKAGIENGVESGIETGVITAVSTFAGSLLPSFDDTLKVVGNFFTSMLGTFFSGVPAEIVAAKIPY